MRRLLALFLTLMLALLPLSALAEMEEDVAIDKITAMIQSALDAEEFTYDLEDTGYFVLTYDSTNGALGDIYAFLDVYDGAVLIYACYEEDVPPDRIDETAKFMNLFNGEVLGTKYFIMPDSGTIFYELPFFLDSEHLGDYEANQVLELLNSVVADIDYDVEYFMEIIGGETAENVFAMFLADYYRE